MKAPIQILMLNGPQSGQAFSFTNSPITFGRQSTNTLIIQLETASRQHGEIRYESGQWVLENLSNNAVGVRGRRISQGKMAALRDDDVITLGRHPIFKVRVSAGEAPTPDIPDQESGESPRRGRKRTTLWIGIGIYMIAMLALVLYISTLGNESTQEQTQIVAELTLVDITAAIKDVPLVGERDQRLAQENLELAREHYHRIDLDPTAMYESYRAYQLSLGYSKKQAFEGLDQRRFVDVEDKLVKEISYRYQLGINQLRSGQYAQAAESFAIVKKRFPDTGNAVYKNVESHLSTANRAMRQRQRQ